MTKRDSLSPPPSAIRDRAPAAGVRERRGAGTLRPVPQLVTGSKTCGEPLPLAPAFLVARPRRDGQGNRSAQVAVEPVHPLRVGTEHGRGVGRETVRPRCGLQENSLY